MLLFAFAFAACEKATDLPAFADGTAPVLTASAATVAPPPADSNKVSLTLTWSDPKYAQDPTLYKFVVEVDSTGRNFSKAVTRTVTGVSKYDFVAKELNTILLGFGFNFNVAYDIDVRVTSSYGNNNEQKKSNTLKLRVTPYKIPPKVALPALGKLFIVGDATQGGWNNPVPVPAQELARIDETTYGGIFQFNGGNQYLLLPQNGSWDTKFAIPSNSAPGIDTIGTFFFSTGPGDNFKAPATSGLYKLTVDFQQGTYKVVPYTGQHGLPANLYMTGGATPLGWSNPVDASQTLTRRNAVQWDITINLTSGQKFLLLPVNGSWGQKFGSDVEAADLKSGTFKPEGSDISAPGTSGNYKVSVDFYTGKYTIQ